MGQGDAVASLGPHEFALDRTVRIRRTWPVVLFLVAVAVGSRVCNRRPLHPNHNESRYNTDYDANGQEGDELRGENLGPPSLEDLPIWKLSYRFGFEIIVSFVGFQFGYRLAGDNDTDLLDLINLLVGPCAVLVGTSIVAVTFAGNWEMTAHQNQRRKNLLIVSWFLLCFAVLAILTAAAYHALATLSSNPLSDSDMRTLGAMATALLYGSVSGFIPLTIRIINLVINQTTDHQNEPRPLDE